MTPTTQTTNAPAPKQDSSQQAERETAERLRQMIADRQYERFCQTGTY